MPFRRWTVSLSGILLALSFLTACISSKRDVEVSRSPDFGRYETYGLRLSSAILEEGLGERIGAALEQSLAGMERVAEAPQIWVEPTIEIGRRTREEDAYFAHNVAKVEEIATLTFDFTETASGESVWRVRGEEALRTLSRASGLHSGGMIPVEEDRAWPIETWVPSLLRR